MSTTTWIMIGTTLIIAQVLNIYIFFIRNHKVFKFQQHLLQLIDGKNRQVIKDAYVRYNDTGVKPDISDELWKWRYNDVQKMSYIKMELMFWKPLIDHVPDSLRKDLAL